MTKTDFVELAKKTLRDYPQISTKAGGTGGSNAFYGSIDNKGKLLKHSHPCHAYMSGYLDSSVVFSKYVVQSETDSIKGRYLNFLLNGPWKCVTDRITYFTDCQGFINEYTNKTPANLQQNFLVASRAIAEWPKLIKEWNYLVTKEDIDPRVAFWFLCLFIPNPSYMNFNGIFPTKQNKEVRFNKSLLYDWALDVQSYDDKAFFNFIKGKPSNFNHMYSTNPVYKPVNEIWGKAQNSKKPETFYTWQLQERYSRKYGKVIMKPNTYAGPLYQTQWIMSYPEMIEIIKQEEERVMNGIY